MRWLLKIIGTLIAVFAGAAALFLAIFFRDNSKNVMIQIIYWLVFVALIGCAAYWAYRIWR